MTLISRIQLLMATDDSDDSGRLARDYNAAPIELQRAVDDALVCICGYSLKTLLSYCRCEDCGHVCALDDLTAIATPQVEGEARGHCPQCDGLAFVIDPEEDE